MSNQTARNSGITGDVDLPGYGAQVQMRATGFGQDTSVQTKVRRGRGGGKYARWRALSAGGSVALAGKVRLDAPPLPDQWKGQEGSVRLTAGRGKTQDLSVLFTGAKFDFDEKTLDTWDVTITAQLLDQPVWTGFGAQPAAVDPEKLDQEQWGEGTVKTVDPSGVMTGATRTTDVWGSLPDTDSGEADRLAAAIAAALPPLPGLKLRTAVFTRDSDDGGSVVETWGQTTPAEDLVNQQQVTLIDPAGVNHKVVRAAAGTAPPAAPAEVATYGLVVVDTNTIKGDGGLTLTVRTWGPRTSGEALEQDGSRATVDAGGLEDRRLIAQLTGSSAAPSAPGVSGLKLRATDSVQQTDGKWLHTFTLARRDSVDDVTMDGSELTVDVAGLRSADKQTLVTATSAAPTPPDPRTGGIKHVWTASRQRHDGAWAHTYGYDYATPAEQLAFRGFKAVRTPDGSDAGGALLEISASPTPGTPPAAPVAGSQFVRTETDRDERTGTYLHLHLYAPLTVTQSKAAEAYRATDDPGSVALVRRALVRVVDASPDLPATPGSPVAGLVPAGSDTTQDPKSGLYLHDFTFAPLANVDAEEAEGSEDAVDPTGLQDGAFVLLITTTSTVPSAPVPTDATLKLTGRKTGRRKDGRWNHRFAFGRRSSQDEVELGTMLRPHYVDHVDPDGIDPWSHRAKLDGTPLTPTGLTLYATETVPLTLAPDHNLTRCQYKSLSPGEEIEHRGTDAAYDITKGDSTTELAVVACVAADTPASLAAAALATYQTSADFETLHFRKINKTRAVREVVRLHNDAAVMADLAAPHQEDLKCLTGSWGTGAAYVRIAQLPGPLIAGPGGYTEARLVHYTLPRQRGTVWLLRRYVVAAGAEGPFISPIAVGYVNDAEFCGYPAHTLMFGRPSVLRRVGLSGGAYLLVARFPLAYDSMEHLNESRFSVGWNTTKDATTYVDLLGDVQADLYFGASWVPTWPTQTDFGVLLP